MANRSSRSKKGKNRSSRSNENKDHLRASKVQDGMSRTEQRAQRVHEKTVQAQRGPTVRMRSETPGGVASLFFCGWLLVGLVAVGGYLLGAWNSFSYPDSLWFYVVLGTVSAMPAIAQTAAKLGDLRLWAQQGAIVAALLLLSELLWGPKCPAGADCGVVGARGALTLPGSVLFIAAITALSYVVGRWWFERVEAARPNRAQGSTGTMISGMLWATILVGLPVAVVAVSTDLLVRKEPAQAKAAKRAVIEYCYEFGAKEPSLSVRPSPEARSTDWSTYLVRNANEKRAGLKKAAPLPKSWARYDKTHPYEAEVAFLNGGDRGTAIWVDCRKVAPDSGTAKPSDLSAIPDIETTNPFKTRDLLERPESDPNAIKADLMKQAKAKIADKKPKTRKKK